VATSLVWYALGVWLGAERTGQALAWASRGPRAVALPALALGLIAISVALVPADELRSLDASHLASLAWRLPVMPAALAGTFAALALADTPRLAASSWLRVLGERSMAIYLLHVMFVAGSRIVLTRLHLPPTPLLPLLVLAGIAGPLLVERALRPLGLRRWLGF
jgi:peptidoglycan/LPS O-acetylase OafA/YrhL